MSATANRNTAAAHPFSFSLRSGGGVLVAVHGFTLQYNASGRMFRFYSSQDYTPLSLYRRQPSVVSWCSWPDEAQRPVAEVVFVVDGAEDSVMLADGQGRVEPYVPQVPCPDKVFCGWGAAPLERTQTAPALLDFAERRFSVGRTLVYAVLAARSGGALADGVSATLTEDFNRCTASYSYAGQQRTLQTASGLTWSTLLGAPSITGSDVFFGGTVGFRLQQQASGATAFLELMMPVDDLSAVTFMAGRNTGTVEAGVSWWADGKWSDEQPLVLVSSRSTLNTVQLPEACTARIRIRLTTYGSGYLYLDDFVFYTRNRSWTLSDFSTDCRMAESALLTFRDGGMYDGRPLRDTLFTVLPASCVLPEPQKRGFVFRSWLLDGVSYAAGDSFVVAHDAVLTAVWELVPSQRCRSVSDLSPFTAEQLAAMDVQVAAGCTLQVASPMAFHDLVLEPGAVLQIGEEAGQPVVLSLNALWLCAGDAAAASSVFPSVRVASGSALCRRQQALFLQLVVGEGRRRMFGLPFPFAVSDVCLADPESAESLVYGQDYVFLAFGGACASADGSSEAVWSPLPSDAVLSSGTAVMLQVLSDRADASLLLPMRGVEDAWLGSGSGESDGRGTVVLSVAAGAGVPVHLRGWNMLASPFLSETVITQAPVPWVQPVAGNAASFVPSLWSQAVLPPGGCCLVQVKEDGSLSFAVEKGLSFPPAAAPDGVPQWRLGLSLVGAGDADRTFLSLSPDASGEYDLGADVLRWFGSGDTLAVYTLGAGLPLACQALPAAPSVEVPLGVRLPSAGMFSFSLSSGTDRSLFERIDLFDRQTGMSVSLLSGDVSFHAAAGKDEARFVLSVVPLPENTAATEVRTSSSGGRRKVLCRGRLLLLADDAVYDMLGRRLSSQ